MTLFPIIVKIRSVTCHNSGTMIALRRFQSVVGFCRPPFGFSGRHQSSRPKLEKFTVATKKKEEVFFADATDNGIRNKVALVTGGAEGIGLRCVRELLKCGAKAVMIADGDEKKGYERVCEISEDFGKKKVAFIRINQADCQLLTNAFRNTMMFYKGLDIVINAIRFKERKSWEDQVDENIKGIILATQLSSKCMGQNSGGRGGTLVNITSSFNESTQSSPVFCGVQDFIVGFDRSIAGELYDTSKIKVLTICQATLESIGCDLTTVIAKGKNGCVWMPH